MTNKSTTAQARKEVRESKIMTLAVVLFASFAFIGMGYIFSLVIFSLTKLF
jgi:preprotein translocase subunit SecE